MLGCVCSYSFLIASPLSLKRDPNESNVEISLAKYQYKVTGNVSARLLEQDFLSKFTPSRTVLVVNTLWYTSLSLSIATAFMAMLAKDWCYSFGAKRTGHPFDQARRRQRKWKLIERWKMPELIDGLSFMMHLSLLLFVVGVCIHLWDLNRTVAIPVISIAGIFLTFYIWTSIIASLVDSFPYTTIISRALRSNHLQPLYLTVGKLTSRGVSTLTLVYIGAHYVYLALAIIPAGILTAFFSLFAILDRYSLAAFTNTSADLFALIQFLWVTAAELVAMPWQILVGLCLRIGSLFNWLTKRLELSEDRTTSLALAWIIQHCETPSAVDIALQAIAGAGQGFPREPLLSCQAIWQIMLRVISHNSSHEDHARNDRYTRGLKFLGFDSNLISADERQKTEEDIELMVWDLKAKHERRIAELTKDGSFIPSDHNFQALKIGTSVASQCLGFLTGEVKTTSETLSTITRLISRHFKSSTERLHPVALHSLAKAAALYASFSTASEIPPELLNLCMKYCETLVEGIDSVEEIDDVDSTCDFGTGVMFVMCILMHVRPASSRDQVSETGLSLFRCQARPGRTIRMLIDVYTEDEKLQGYIFWLGCCEILCNPSSYGLKMKAGNWEGLRRWCNNQASHSLNRLVPPFMQSWNHDQMKRKVLRNRFITAASRIRDLVVASRPSGTKPPPLPEPIHIILAILGCDSSLPSRKIQECHKLLSQSQIPRPSEALIEIIKTEMALTILVATYLRKTQPHAQRHFAATQLWLLFYLSSGRASLNKCELREMIKSMIASSPQLRTKEFDQFQRELEDFIIIGYRKDHVVYGGVGGDESRSRSIWDRFQVRLQKWQTEASSQ
ncbi:unnamed protein product [Rhizoctonia solani]|uniref:DUF6535 domain-containing protein n=1 Tax=Rhizoctonia solani TaxID=456999 RepID=A0A8H3GTY2_9AGAM|nr:unnamed protein product [Rhizoctonia solani]